MRSNLRVDFSFDNGYNFFNAFRVFELVANEYFSGILASSSNLF